MRIYLAARYSRREELCEYRRQLEELGHTVTSRWLDGSHQISDSGVPISDEGEALLEEDIYDLEAAAALRREFAGEDLADLYAAEVMISFTERPHSGASRGSRHVEFGVALGWRRIGFTTTPRLIVVGHRENLFHWLPVVEFYETWQEALDAI